MKIKASILDSGSYLPVHSLLLIINNKVCYSALVLSSRVFVSPSFPRSSYVSSVGWNVFVDEYKNLWMLVSFMLNKWSDHHFSAKFLPPNEYKASGSCQDLTVFVYVECLLGGASWSEFLTLKMFLLTRYSKKNKKEKIGTHPSPPPIKKDCIKFRLLWSLRVNVFLWRE
jgi:hypothetical protein